MWMLISAISAIVVFIYRLMGCLNRTMTIAQISENFSWSQFFFSASINWFVCKMEILLTRLGKKEHCSHIIILSLFSILHSRFARFVQPCQGEMRTMLQTTLLRILLLNIGLPENLYPLNPPQSCRHVTPILKELIFLFVRRFKKKIFVFHWCCWACCKSITN